MKVIFMGTPDFSVGTLEALVAAGHEVVLAVTQPDKPKGRGKEMQFTPVKEAALRHQIPVFQPKKVRDPECMEELRKYNADIMVVIAFGQILPQEILDMTPYGCVNVHASLLPKYRGGAPIHKAIIDGEKETGVTIMYMDVKMDTGDMISKVVVPIGEKDHTGSMFEKLSLAGAELLTQTLPKLLAGELEATPQNHEEATFAWNIKREDERIDWYKPANVLYNQVRGLHPWPVAFTQLDDLSVKIWWAEPNNHLYDAEPGTIVKVEKDGIVVACGDHAGLKITDIQISGKKRMDVASLLNGSHPIEVGKKFN